MTEVPTTPACSIVIAAHNAESCLPRQLLALASQDNPPSFEVIVVANRCTDRTVEVAQSFKNRLPGLRVLVADAKAGPSFARNSGARIARGPVLLFCDADDEVASSWVRAMFNCLHENDIVGGVAVPEWEGLPRWIQKLPNTPKTPDVLAGLALFDGRIWYPGTASMGCHRDQFEESGGFDEDLATSEDLDFALRLLRRGGRLGIAEEATYSYALRTEWRPLIRQRAAYLRGNAELMSRMGVLKRPKLGEIVKPLVRRLGHELFRQHEFEPRFYLAMIELAGLRYWIFRQGAARQDEPIGDLDPVDAVLPVRLPTVGGLAVRTTHRAASYWAADDSHSAELSALGVLLQPGDHFVDVGANVGVLTLAAALLVGEGGSVSCSEPDAVSRALLEETLARHGLWPRVEISSRAIGDPNDPITTDTVYLDETSSGLIKVLRVSANGSELAVLRGASALLCTHPETSILIDVNTELLSRSGSSWRELIAEIEGSCGREALLLGCSYPLRKGTQQELPTDLCSRHESTGPLGWRGTLLGVAVSQRASLAAAGLELTRPVEGPFTT